MTAAWLPYPGSPGVEYRRTGNRWETRCTTCLIVTRQDSEDPDPSHRPGCRSYSLTRHPCGAPKTKKEMAESQGATQ